MKNQITGLLTLILISVISCQTDIENQKSNNEEANQLLIGERLFLDFCSACHSKNLDEYSTGPPLGHITKYRELGWLIKSVKYPSEMIMYGDSISLCNWDKYQPSIKGSLINAYYGFEKGYPTKTPDIEHTEIDSKIRAIFEWIEEESIRQGIEVDSMEKVYECTINDHKGIKETEGDIEKIIRGAAGIDWISKLRGISDLGKHKRIEVFLETDKDKNLFYNVTLIFPGLNLAIPFVEIEDRLILLGTNGKKRIPYPNEEYAMIYVWTSKEGDCCTIKELPRNENIVKIKNSDFNLTYDQVRGYKLKK